MGDMADSIVAGRDEVLDDGLSAVTPDGDNVVLDFSRVEAAGYRAVAEAAGGRISEDDDLLLTDTGSPSVFGNVGHTHRPVIDAAAFAARVRGFYEGHPGGAALVFSALPTPDLAPYGLQPVGHPPLMLREPGGEPAPLPDGLEIRRATTPEEIAVFERTLVESYPVPECIGAPPGSMIAPALADDPDWVLLVGYLRGEPVATSALRIGPALGAVEFVSTGEAARGRGVGAAMTAAAARSAGDRPSALIASDLGRSVYERIGYRTVMRFTLWVVPRG